VSAGSVPQTTYESPTGTTQEPLSVIGLFLLRECRNVFHVESERRETKENIMSFHRIVPVKKAHKPAPAPKKKAPKKPAPKRPVGHKC